MPAGEWNHVAIVVTPTTYQFYLNGQPDGNGTHNRTLSTSSMPFMIGRQGSDFVNNLWHGRLDDLRVWSVARTQSEIQNGMPSNGLAVPSLIHIRNYWSND